MFLFEQMFNNAVAGIVGAGFMDTVLIAAYGILLASLLFSVYEAWTRGGDVRAVGVAGVKYLAIGLLLMNDGAVYRSVFQSVLGIFNEMARNMAGPGDVFRTWFGELRTAATWPTFLNLVTGVSAGLISTILLMVAMILYPVAYGVFTVLYCLFGTILYVVGPLVLALFPSIGLGSLARRYATNFVIFASWGLIYGIMCRLMLALNVNSMAAITGAGSFMGLMSSATAEVLLAAVSILFSVCILLIPFLAKRIVEGDLGSAMFAVLGTTAAMTQALTAIAAGGGDGWSRVAGGGGEAGASSVGGASGASTGGTPPSPSGDAGSASPPSTGGRAPTGPGPGHPIGEHRPMNLPHALGWLAGASAALAARAGSSAMGSVRGAARSGGQTSTAVTPPASAPSEASGVDEWV